MDEIKEVNKPCVILAGAGTGKTRTITEKAAYLIENHIFQAQNIACVTFSNEAVDSLQRRLLLRLGENQLPIVRTFHALCGDLLKAHGEKIGLDRKFKIMTPEDGMIMLYQCFKTNPMRCGKYVETIGALKDALVSFEKYEMFMAAELKTLPEQPERELELARLLLHTKKLDKEEKDQVKDKIEKLNTYVQQKNFLQAWKSYEKLKTKQKLLDYGDLHQKALELLRVSPGITQDIHYLIVDEFQDTNRVQLELIHALAPRGNVTVVGDLNQSIYQFRGAHKGNFENFKALYGVDTVAKLDKSHRSPNRVLRVAHACIEHNYQNKDDCFLVKNSYSNEGTPIESYELVDSKEEVRKILELIQKQLAQGVAAEEICVLFRTHHQAAMLKRVLQGQGIVFAASKRQALLEHASVASIRALAVMYDKLKYNKTGGAPYVWALARTHGMSTEDLGVLGKYTKEYKGTEPLCKHLLEKPVEGLSEEGAKKFEAIKEKIRRIKDLDDRVGELLPVIAAMTSSEEQPSEETVAIQAFTEYAKEFAERDYGDVGTFLAHLDAREQLHLDLLMPQTKREGVRIMTAHATKGLEYEVVILANLVQGKFPIETVKTNKLFPSALSKIEEELVDQIAEERRLFYVACTRTKKQLYLTYALSYGGKNHEPSQFLEEINYKSSPDIVFTLDHERTALEEKPELKPATAHVKKTLTFSPSALNLFKDCQKRYEYKYIFNMPEEVVAWEQRALGSFVHLVIEEGVKELFTSERQFIGLAHGLATKPEWQGVKLEEAEALLRIFFERNKNKYNKNSKNEVGLFMMLEGLKFVGYADRLDITDSGDVEVIDYKTGSHVPTARERDWQLGFYALAAQRYGTVKRVTLDIFKNEKPLEYELDEKGTARDTRSNRVAFSLPEVRKELIATAKSILDAYQKGFQLCSGEKNCDFCQKL